METKVSDVIEFLRNAENKRWSHYNVHCWNCYWILLYA